MSAHALCQFVLRTVHCCAPARRQCVGACLLVSYVVGTVGLPAPLAGPGKSCHHGVAGSHACCCSASSILAGTCCCSKPVVQRSCCSEKTAQHSVRTMLRESVKTATHSCCTKTESSKSVPSQDSSENELRVSGCPCGPGAPDASFVCADPRLATEPVIVSGPVRVEAGPAVESISAPGGALEPLTPPPRVVA
jgi:hypothetical protein